MIELEIPTPSWAERLLDPARYKVAKGGRSGGKSHFFAELAVERMVCDPNCAIVCIREIQKSLKFSAKRLIEQKISALKLEDLFDITLTEIRRKGGSGVCIFQGMQDHTADSVKSLESFDVAWVEEAQRLSRYSLDLLRPTIRKPGSELWFSFNPCWPDDPVDKFFNETRPTDAIIVTVNAPENPFLSDVARQEMIEDQRHRPAEEYAHIWLGEHKSISKEQIFAGKCRIAEFAPAPDWDGPYYGADWGFGPDPTTAVLCWIHDDRLWVERESYEWRLELDHVAQRWQRDLPGIEAHTVRCDCAQPQSISYVRRHGIPGAVGAKKWSGSVEDGINHLRNYREIVIHPRCEWMIYESRRYRYKTNAAGDILPTIVDADNHCLSPGTMILTDKGNIPIEKICPGDMVLTRAGYKKVLWAGQSDSNRIVYAICTHKGRVIYATENHKILTKRGFVRVDALRYNDTVLAVEERQCLVKQWIKKLSNMAGLCGVDTHTQNAGTTEYITSRLGRVLLGGKITFTVKSGLITLAQFLKDFTSTTRTRTRLTTLSPTLSAFPSLTTCGTTFFRGRKRTETKCFNTSTISGRSPLDGTQHQKERSFTPNWLKTLLLKSAKKLSNIASNAERNTLPIPSVSAVPDFAPTLVNPNGDVLNGLMTPTLLAQFVSTRSGAANTHGLKLVADSVRDVCKANVELAVYDLTVEEQHEFFANGLLVHNCFDALRYALGPLIRENQQSRRLPVPTFSR